MEEDRKDREDREEDREDRESLTKHKTSPGPEPESQPPEQDGRGLLFQRRTNWWSSGNDNVNLQLAFQME